MNYIEVKLATVLFKLENNFLLSSSASNNDLCELWYFIGSLSVPVTQDIDLSPSASQLPDRGECTPGVGINTF